MELPGAKESKLSARYTSSFYAASDLKKKKRSSTTGPVEPGGDGWLVPDESKSISLLRPFLLDPSWQS